MKAILLAAGKGIRLEPITKNTHKSMISICGKPILEHIIHELIDLGITEIGIVVGHLSDQIINHFGDGEKLKAKISYFFQTENKGTADALKVVKKFTNKDDFLVYLADTLIPNELSSSIKNMRASDTDISILSSEVVPEKLKIASYIEVDDENLIRNIVEKPDIDKSGFAWAGLAYFKNQEIFKIIENLDLSKRNEYDLTDAFLKVVLSGRIIKNFQCSSFIDFGTLNGLLNAVKYLIRKKMDNNNNVFIGKNCKIGKNVIIEPYSSIGNNVIIENNVKIKNSLIFDNEKIHQYQIINNSVYSNGEKFCYQK